VEGYEENHSLLSPEKMLWIGGKAADRETSESLSVTQIDFWYENENVTYRQIFDPPIFFDSIGKRYIFNEPTESTVIYRSRGGCEVGFGAAAVLLLLFAAAVRARGRF
jgi:hypothetical protein